MDKQEFAAIIQKPPNAPGSWVVIPFSVQQVYGTRGRVKVNATFDGHPYRGSIAPMGGGRHVLGLRKEIAAAIGKGHGDTVQVAIELDAEPRQVVVPGDLKQALERNREAAEFFDSLSYTNRKEYVGWIESAKKKETRLRRLQNSVEMLLNGIKHP